ncbi:MAG TPA: hypothetical protein DDY98_06150, partial [Ruminococcaceae bacterium]|nr:hypothetical protein [Oscillospiraceae bacterium]
MIVEFFGLPGSGKTVNTEALLLHYGERAHQLLPKRSVLRKGGFRRIFTLEFLSFFFKAVSLWLKKKHKVRYD